MKVRDGMTATVLTVEPQQTLREAASRMSRHRVGALIVRDPAGGARGILTERDVLESVAAGQDPDRERAVDHVTPELVAAGPDWSLRGAAAAMLRGGFRHLVVLDGADLVGVLSMRDIVRAWSREQKPEQMVTP
jgi:CBS domain-containing protein